MCIALISTAHPKYRLILIDNRDEYLNRPTAVAEWWPSPDEKVLGGRDMLRDVHGTWLGVTKNGKVAVLTNYREDVTPPPGAVSRGAIIKKFLTEDVGPVEEFVKDVVNTGIAKDAGGFSLVCGHIGEKLAIISNRAADQTEVPWIAGDVVQTVGLSNAAYSDRSWKKVVLGEELMLNAIRQSIDADESEDALIERLLEMLSHDTLPRQEKVGNGALETNLMKLRETIYVPPLGRKDMSCLRDDEIATAKEVETVNIIGHNNPMRSATPTANGIHPTFNKALGVSGIYGTQKQTVLLADRDGSTRFFERTLFDENSDPIAKGQADIDVSFRISPD